MITYQIAPGTTDVSVVIRIVDSADGTPETGVVFNTSGIDLEYRREGAASTDITEATLAALTTAHTDGGFLHIGNGYYRLDLPDAACATGVSGCLVHGTVTGMVVIGCYIQLEAAVNKVYSDTTIIYSDTTIATSKTTQIYSDTAIASSKAVQIYSDTSIIYSDTTIIYSDTTIATSKTTQIYSDTAIASSKAVQIYSDTTIIYSDTTVATSKTTQIYSDTAIIYSDTTRIHSDTTYLTGPGDGTAGAFPEWGIIDQGTAQSATSTTIVLRAATPFGSDDANLGCTVLAYGSDQGYWQARLITDYTTADDTVTVDAWDVTPSGTITYKIFGTPPTSSGSMTAAQDSKLTRVNSKATQIYSDTAIIYSDTTIATSKTTQIYSDTAIASSKGVQIYSDTTIVTSKTTQIYSDTAIASSKVVQVYSDTTAVHSDTTAVHSDTTAIHTQTTTIASDVAQVYSDTTIAVSDTTRLEQGIIFGAAATGTLSTTQASTNLSGYANDQLIGRVVIWLSGACEGEASDITDYVETNGVLTFTALTTAPGNGDTFKIV